MTDELIYEDGEIRNCDSNVMMTAIEFINIMRPDHDRTSCSDEYRLNSFFSRNGETWHGRCTRCMWLDIADGVKIPENFEKEDCQG